MRQNLSFFFHFLKPIPVRFSMFLFFSIYSWKSSNVKLGGVLYPTDIFRPLDISLCFFFFVFFFAIFTEAPVAQLVKGWPSKLAVQVQPATLDGWMDDLRFYILFNSNSVISG